MDDNLRSICTQKQETTRVGFSSAEFEDASIQGDFKTSVDLMAIDKIKEDIEGRCIGDGYVIPGSVELVERSKIAFPHEALQLHYSMNVRYNYQLCNPNPGTVIECKIVTKNKIGILGRLTSEKSPLIILVPGDLCDTPEKRTVLDKAQKDTMLKVIVVGKKFEQNDKKITVVAEIA